MSIGVYIRNLRKQRNLTQAALATKAKLSRPFISRLENGDYETIDINTAKSLARALESGVEDLLNAQGKNIETMKYRPLSLMSDLTSRLPTEIPIYKRLDGEIQGYVYLYVEGRYKSMKALMVEGYSYPPDIMEGALVVVDTVVKPDPDDLIVVEQSGKYEIIKISKDQAERLNPAVYRGLILLTLTHYQDKVKFYLS